MTGVRYGELGFEGRCDGCLEYYPIDVEFWPVRGRGLRICRACDQERNRLRARARRPQQLLYNRAYVAENRASHNAKRAQQRMERRLRDPDYCDRVRLYHREWMRRKRAAA